MSVRWQKTCDKKMPEHIYLLAAAAASLIFRGTDSLNMTPCRPRGRMKGVWFFGVKRRACTTHAGIHVLYASMDVRRNKLLWGKGLPGAGGLLLLLTTGRSGGLDPAAHWLLWA